MERKEVYNQIKTLGLEEEVKNTFGRNYTQVKTDLLKSFVEDYYVQKESKCENKIQNSFSRLLEVLKNKYILLKHEIEFIQTGK